MENVLTERTQEWMNLERATLKQRMIADEFYEKKLMRPIVSEFLMNNKEAVREEVEGMILTVGTSYEPLVLSIQLFKPKRILFLYTPNTERFIDKVIKFCRLKNSTYDKRMVREGEPLDVYREIKTAYLAWRSEEHTSELQSRFDLVCRLLLEKQKIRVAEVSIVIRGY